MTESETLTQKASRLAAEPMYRITAWSLAFNSGDNWSAEYSDGSWRLATPDSMSERERGQIEAYISLIPAVYYMIPLFWLAVWFFQLSPEETASVFIGGSALAIVCGLLWLSLKQLGAIELEVIENV